MAAIPIPSPVNGGAAFVMICARVVLVGAIPMLQINEMVIGRLCC